MDAPLDLLARTDGDAVRLCSPDVGLYTEAPAPGSALAPGQRAGTLLRLGRPVALRVPAGVAGRVVSALPERVQQPVAYGEAVLELAPLEELGALDPEADVPDAGALVLLAPQSGRFYHRPAPDEPPFVVSGDELNEGRPVGLIEVMKTFAHVAYRAQRGLPARARMARYLVADGAEVEAGAPLLEVERF